MKKIIQLSAMLLASSGFVLATQVEAPKTPIVEKTEEVKTEVKSEVKVAKKAKKSFRKSHHKVDNSLTDALNKQTGPYVAQATIVVPVCEKAKDENHAVKTHKKGRKKSPKKVEAAKEEVKASAVKEETKTSVAKEEVKPSVAKEETKTITEVKEEVKSEPSVVPAAPVAPVAPAAPVVPK